MRQRPRKLQDQVRDAIRLKHSVGLASLLAGPIAERVESKAKVKAEVVPARRGVGGRKREGRRGKVSVCVEDHT